MEKPRSAGDELLAWYKSNLPGEVRAERLGLDGRSVLVTIEGRRRLRLLVTLYDPENDGDFLEWLHDIISSHRRAGISFDRVEVWVPGDISDRLIEVVESEGLSGLVTLRPHGGGTVSSGLDRITRGADEITGTLDKMAGAKTDAFQERGRSERVRDVGTTEDEVRSLRAVVDEIREAVKDSIKSALQEVKRQETQADVLAKLYELEKRIELLEAMIRLIGSGSLPAPQREIIPTTPAPTALPHREEGPIEGHEEPRGSPRTDTKTSEDIVKYDSGGRTSESSGPPEGSEDILEEILDNPWVEILREKGESG